MHVSLFSTENKFGSEELERLNVYNIWSVQAWDSCRYFSQIFYGSQSNIMLLDQTWLPVTYWPVSTYHFYAASALLSAKSWTQEKNQGA